MCPVTSRDMRPLLLLVLHVMLQLPLLLCDSFCYCHCGKLQSRCSSNQLLKPCWLLLLPLLLQTLRQALQQQPLQRVHTLCCQERQQQREQHSLTHLG